MTERERLIELLKESGNKVGEYIMENDKMDYTPTTDEICGVRADYLLKNGVIVPPCQVGDTVWYLNRQPHIALFQNSVYKAEVVRIVTTHLGTALVIQIKSEGCCEIPDVKNWGEAVFLTREEAEQALKGGEG